MTASAGFTLREFALGTRLVVRSRIEGGFTDALGTMTALDAASCVIETKRGPVSVPLADIVAAKEVPPAPAPRPRRVAPPEA